MADEGALLGTAEPDISQEDFRFNEVVKYAQEVLEYSKKRCEGVLEEKFKKALGNLNQAAHDRAKEANKMMLKTLPRRIKEYGDDWSKLYYLRFTHALGLEVFKSMMICVWDKLGVDTSKKEDNLSRMVDNFVLFCKCMKKATPEQKTLIKKYHKVFYSGEWRTNEWRSSHNEDKKTLNELCYKAMKDDELKTTVRSSFLQFIKLVSAITPFRNLDEHIGIITQIDMLTGDKGEGNFFTTVSLYVLSLYSYEELLDLINTYL